MADVEAINAPADEHNGAGAPTAVATNGTSAGEASSAPATAALTPDEARKGVKKLIEFYFGDSNLPFDRFFFTLTHRDPEGWVPLSIIKTFKRMRPFMDVLSVEDVASVIRTSEDLEVSAEGDKIKRNKPLVPQKDAYERSVYVKGFPEETATLQQELEAFFDQFGKIQSVRMRRDQHSKPKRNAFKGSVFVEFANSDEMTAFLEKGAESLAEDARLKYNDTVLKIMSKDAYCQMKMAEKGIDPNTARGSHNSGAARGKRFNAFRELEREAQGLPSALSESAEGEKDGRHKRQRDDAERQAAKAKRIAEAKEKRSLPLEFEFLNKTLKTRPDGTVDPDVLEFPERSVVTFKGAGAGGNWRDLKETLSTMCPTSFVEFPDGAVEGAVGFRSTLDDDKFNEIVNKGILVGGQPVEWARPDEARSKQFYLDRANFRATILVNQREEVEANGGVFDKRGGGGNNSGRGFGHGRGGGGGRGRGRGGGRGGRGGGRHHGHGDNKRKREAYNVSEDGPPQIMDSKKAKTAA